MRPRKKHNLDKRMQAASPYRVDNPVQHKGRWRALFGADEQARLHIEIGCGKGTFVCESAKWQAVNSPTEKSKSGRLSVLK